MSPSPDNLQNRLGTKMKSNDSNKFDRVHGSRKKSSHFLVCMKLDVLPVGIGIRPLPAFQPQIMTFNNKSGSVSWRNS